jgi:hypothetical protein
MIQGNPFDEFAGFQPVFKTVEIGGGLKPLLLRRGVFVVKPGERLNLVFGIKGNNDISFLFKLPLQFLVFNDTVDILGEVEHIH